MSGGADRGGGYVKFVLAGGKTIQVRGPVRAGDVMQSTGYYVTRPDVFRVPPHSALIDPKAILMPGLKFYLISFHTMVSLLSSSARTPPSPSPPPSPQVKNTTCWPWIPSSNKENSNQNSQPEIGTLERKKKTVQTPPVSTSLWIPPINRWPRRPRPFRPALTPVMESSQ